MPKSNRSGEQLRLNCHNQRTNDGSGEGRRTNAPPRVTSWCRPSRTMPGPGSGAAMLGTIQPVLPAETPPPSDSALEHPYRRSGAVELPRARQADDTAAHYGHGRAAHRTVSQARDRAYLTSRASFAIRFAERNSRV